MSKIILGISAFYHDSAAAIIIDGRIAGAIQEERLTRKKHDQSFPIKAITQLLSDLDIQPDEIDIVAFYEKPLVKFERLLTTFHRYAPLGFKSFMQAIPPWIKDKIFFTKYIKEELASVGIKDVTLLFPEHHLSHAASAFFPSPFERAAILTLDGVGEWQTTTLSLGDGNTITTLKEINFPHSLGLLYSAFTYYCGFKVNDGEYKLMGLAPYGSSSNEQTKGFIDKIEKTLIDVKEDGSFLLNLPYFDFPVGDRMTKDSKWEALFGIPKRNEIDPITMDTMNLAYAIQHVTEKIVIKLAKSAIAMTGCDNLVMAGGVALNCVANGKIINQKEIKDLWIQPAAGDAGGAIGAAAAAYHIYFNKPRELEGYKLDQMSGCYLGPSYSNHDINKVLSRHKQNYNHIEEIDVLCSTVAKYLAEGKVVGWFQDRMEFGPRALGNRSILASPSNAEMQKKINLKIKFREGFRPFAPVILESRVSDYFDINVPSPYMLLVAPVKDTICNTAPDDYEKQSMYERLYFSRSSIPAVTHVDYSARIQTVSDRSNPKLAKLIKSFDDIEGIPILVNTSFNVKDEPIVCTPEDAYLCFRKTEMDVLVLGDFVICKEDLI